VALVLLHQLHNLSSSNTDRMARARGRAGRRRNGGNGRRRQPGPNSDMGGMMLKRVAPDCHRFIRRDLVALDGAPTGAGASFGLAISFSLDQLPNYTDFTNLFDHYSIDRIELAAVPGVATIQIASCLDLDDAVAPTGIADILERQGASVTTVGQQSYQQWRRSFVPRMPIEGPTAGPQMAPLGTKVDTADPSVQYFGYKFWLTPADVLRTSAYTGWYFVATYHLRFWAAK
jgi:hypothetical protein